ncbi:hypothetical protein MCC93_00540 [Morococcus cerebrosus]|uniref:Uncharacterized protein n=1 Tax=Morococcus cerebrosus TaxID=1056807 RepID=A0A0C1EVF8_9NEIS|nr:hypothetical protein MCC93_00540 [Morococcus cerebrosus]
MPRLAVLSVLSAASSPCPDLKLINYTYASIQNDLSCNRSSENTDAA